MNRAMLVMAGAVVFLALLLSSVFAHGRRTKSAAITCRALAFPASKEGRHA